MDMQTPEPFPATARWAKDFILAGIEEIEKLYESKGANRGLSTGFPSLDARMGGGLRDGEMIVIAGRPKMGKSALALNIAEHAAVDAGQPVVIFTLEMSAAHLSRRLLGSRARVSLDRLRTGHLTERDFPDLTLAAAQLAGAPLLIDEAPALTIEELGQRLRHYVGAHGVRLAIIDSLQLVRPAVCLAQENRRAEISEVSGGVKSLARELKIPIIALSPLNRNPENRRDPTPRLEDIKGSRLIAQDADVVLMLKRDEFYAATREETRRNKGKVMLVIAKQPQGPSEVFLNFEEEFARFQEIRAGKALTPA